MAAPPSAAPGWLEGCAVLLVRGLFGAWIPGHFRAPLQRLRALGCEALIAHTAPAGTLAQNQALLAAQVRRLVAQGRRPVFLAHSKGGIEVLLMLAAEPGLAQATAGFVGVQMPWAGAPYLESVFCGSHRDSRKRADAWREGLDAAVLTLAGARAACAELNADTLAPHRARIAAQAWPFEPWCVATQASRPSRSLELKHERLNRIRPGQPHDGVAYTADQQGLAARTLLLEGIDHAQPSVGGLGFAHDRFWAALLMLLDPAEARA